MADNTFAPNIQGMVDLLVGPEVTATADPDVIREQLYRDGLGKLKSAFAGTDYVPPWANFNDTPTHEQAVRDWLNAIPTTRDLKYHEKSIEDRFHQDNGWNDQDWSDWGRAKFRNKDYSLPRQDVNLISKLLMRPT